MHKPKKWTEVYHYGTKEGDEEAKFFKALARHHKFDYRSISQLIKITGLSQERLEEIIDKYVTQYDPPLIVPHPQNEDHWGYWERCQDQLKSDQRNISQKDHDKRVDKHMSGTPSLIDSSGDGSGCDDDCSACP